MSDDDTHADPPDKQTISPEDLEKMRAAWKLREVQENEQSAARSADDVVPRPSPVGGSGLGKKLLGAVLIAAIGVGASIMSCVGQSFSYRQARAMEGIEQQLKELRAEIQTSRGATSGSAAAR